MWAQYPNYFAKQIPEDQIFIFFTLVTVIIFIFFLFKQLEATFKILLWNKLFKSNQMWRHKYGFYRTQMSHSVPGFVRVDSWICQSCSMYFSPFAKQNQAEVWPRFKSLLKFLLWTKCVEWFKVLNPLDPLCFWQCLYIRHFEEKFQNPLWSNMIHIQFEETLLEPNLENKLTKTTNVNLHQVQQTISEDIGNSQRRKVTQICNKYFDGILQINP